MQFHQSNNWFLAREFMRAAQAVHNARSTLNFMVKNNRNVNSKHNWSSNGIDFWHVAVQFMHDGKWYSCDSDSVHRGIDRFGKRRLMHKAPGSGFTVNEAIGFAEEVEGWNSCFNRTDIPAVKNLIDKYLSPLLTTQVQ